MTKKKTVYSLDGRPYATIKNVRAGHWLEVDGGFTCLPRGARVRVLVDANTADLFVTCMAGKHFLDGQAE